MLREAAPTDVSGQLTPGSSELDHLSTQLSALLADMVRAPEVEVAATWSPEVKPGGTIGRFELTRELGRGGFGVVFEATDRELSRTVALKVVRPGTRIAARGSQWLLREAEAVARLNHPNIITLHDLGQDPSGPYLVFELLRGRTLHEALRAGPLPVDAVLETAIAVARALVHAHAAGVVHRDLTAGNVFLVGDAPGGGGLRPPTGGQGPSHPEIGTVKVLDFGLAHLFGRDGANDGGTPAYMAPEQWEGDRGDGRTDLFALGVILFQSLTGRFPYKVDKGWSEALEPGRTPRLPRQAAPARLRRLVEALLDREPELRPESAKAVRDELLAIHRARSGAGGRRTVWGFAVVTAAAVSAAGWLSLQREPPPGEQIHTVVTAMENGAGDPTLDAVPGLLAVALEPSPRVKVVPPSRLAYASRQAGLGDPGKLDAEKGRSLARLAGAEVVLVPSAWRADGVAVVGVRAVESESGKKLFSMQAPLSGRGGLPGLVDQLSDRIRRELKERAADQKLRRPVAETVTADPEAARFYYEGLDCLQRVALPIDCQGSFEQALASDPSFPLAHFQLAAANLHRGDSGELARPHLEAALRGADRLPPREKALLAALSARMEGRFEEALRAYDELLAATPDDPQLLAAAASVQTGRGDWASAVRYLQKLVTVEPSWEDPLLDLIEALGRLNRKEDLRALLATIDPKASHGARASVEAHLWLGEPDQAVATARRAVTERGDVELEALSRALYAAGDFVAMEPIARRAWAAQPGIVTTLQVEVALTGQGRIAEALRWADQSAARLPRSQAAETLFRQALISAATHDSVRVWRYASRAANIDPVYCADLAVVLLLLGDVEHAESLAKGLVPGSAAERQFHALRAWRAGDPTTASAELTGIEEHDPLPVFGLAPAYLLAEVSAAMGDDAGTLAAVSRFEHLPARGSWTAWALPRARLLAAGAQLRLGDRVASRLKLDRVLPMFSRADSSFPLLAQAQRLQRQLREERPSR